MSVLLGRLGRRAPGKSVARVGEDVEKSQPCAVLPEEVSCDDATSSLLPSSVAASSCAASGVRGDHGEAPPELRRTSMEAIEHQAARSEEFRAEVCMETPSIYFAVLVAAFGGVRALKGNGRRAKVHPAFLLVLCVPVFVTQASAILFLRTDLDTDRPVYEPGNARSVALLKLKLVMVIVIYLMNFKTLVMSITQLVFVINPITWVEVAHPSRDDWKFCGCCWRVIKYLFSTPSLWPCPVVALTMNLLVNYLVCVDSVSVILSAQDAKDAIFDGLAIQFVMEMSSAWWSFCAHTFVFDNISNYKFTLREEKETWGQEGWLADSRYSQLVFPRLVNFAVWLTSLPCLGVRQSFLRIGHGANRLIRALALAILFALYCRQFFIVLHAVDSKILPAARDLCTEYHLAMENTQASKIWHAFQSVTFVSVDEELLDRDDMRYNCLGEGATLQRLTFETAQALLHKYSHVFVVFVASVGGALFLPTLAHASQAWYGGDVEAMEERKLSKLRSDLGFDDLHTVVTDLQKRVSELEGAPHQ